MKQYLQLLQTILDDGEKSSDRTGTGTLRIPGYHYACKMYKDDQGIIHNFPLLTTKFVSLKSVFEELKWKLSGDTNIKFLVEHNNHIWTEWPFKKWLEETGQTELLKNMWKNDEKSAYSDEWKATLKEFETKILENEDFCKEWGELGHTYGFQFRHSGELRSHCPGIINDITHPGVDQLMSAIDKIKKNPDSRRIIIDLWNPQDEDKTLLPPCPCFYQFLVYRSGTINLSMTQRSCDTFLGVPYNTAQESLLLCMVAQVTGYKPNIFNHFFNDAHIYLNHIDQVKEQLTRTPHPLPSIRLNPDVKNILDFKWEDIELIGYEHDAGIRGAVSIWMKSFSKNRRNIVFCGLFYILKFYATVNQNLILQFSLSNVSLRVSQSVFHSEISIIKASSFRNSANSFTIFFISSLSDW